MIHHATNAASVLLRVIKDIPALGAVVGDVIVARFGPGLQHPLILQHSLPLEGSPLLVYRDALLPVEITPGDASDSAAPRDAEPVDEAPPPPPGPPHLALLRGGLAPATSPPVPPADVPHR